MDLAGHLQCAGMLAPLANPAIPGKNFFCLGASTEHFHLLKSELNLFTSFGSVPPQVINLTLTSAQETSDTIMEATGGIACSETSET